MTDHRDRRQVESRRWRASALSLLVAGMCLLGVAVALYPATASWFSTLQEDQQIARYGHTVKILSPQARTRALQQADAYNTALRGGAEVQANQRIPVNTDAQLPTGFDYTTLLRADPYGLMGRIVIPSIGVDLPIYHGTSDATLERGIGHLEGSSLPVGGAGTHAVLAGHRGLASATLFTNLNQVTRTDTFTLYVFGETLSYKVISVKVVNPDQTKTLNPVPGRDLVTLVTCTPIGVNSQRILVTGERVLPAPAAAIAGAHVPPAGPGFPGWAALFALALLTSIAYIWWAGRPVPDRARAVNTTPATPKHWDGTRSPLLITRMPGA